MRSKGEGSIYKGSDGRHMAAVSTPTGRVYLARRKSESFDAFKTRVDQALKGAKRGRRSTESLDAFLKTWLATIKPTVRPKTYESYEETVRLYLVPAIGHVTLGKLTPAHVQQAMQLAVSQKRAVRTVAYVRAVLRRALHIAQRWDLVAVNVATLVDPPRMEKRHFDMPDDKEIGAILKAIADDPYEPLLLLLALAGPRRGEALGLQWPDLDGGTLRFNRSLQRVKGEGLQPLPLKTAASKRAISLPPVLVDSLKRWRVRQLEWRLQAGEFWQESDFLFTTRIGTPISPEKLRAIVNALLKRAGAKHYRIHDFRHIAATALLMAGAPLEMVSDVLGHSSIRVTKDIYIATRVHDAAAAHMQNIATASRRDESPS